ncbi:hypothetical protein [Ornithinimicrobium kibberense]|uniref:hypothetical protein n=1 Tax=Ornithinimicrobium kibberense TaxID=282060 RepID=UPI00361AF27D
MLWPTPAWLARSAATAAPRVPAETNDPTPAPITAAAAPRAGWASPPAVDPRLVVAVTARWLAWPSADTSPAGRPCPSRVDAAPEVATPRPVSPRRPPWASYPARIAAPEEVPGSTNASSLNRASGENAAMQIRNTPGIAVPIVVASPSASPWTTPVVTEVPRPSTRATRTGVNAAAWNHRNDVQNQPLENPAASPAAAIGPVATSTSRAPARVSMTSRNPTPPSHRTRPRNPRTVASSASVMSSAAMTREPEGSQWANASTPNMARSKDLVRPCAAARIITVYPTQAANTTTNWATPMPAWARSVPSRRQAATPSWTIARISSRAIASQNVVRYTCPAGPSAVTSGVRMASTRPRTVRRNHSPPIQIASMIEVHASATSSPTALAARYSNGFGITDHPPTHPGRFRHRGAPARWAGHWPGSDRGPRGATRPGRPGRSRARSRVPGTPGGWCRSPTGRRSRSWPRSARRRPGPARPGTPPAAEGRTPPSSPARRCL